MYKSTSIVRHPCFDFPRKEFANQLADIYKALAWAAHDQEEFCRWCGLGYSMPHLSGKLVPVRLFCSWPSWNILVSLPPLYVYSQCESSEALKDNPATQYCDGLRGPLIIYDPRDPHRSLYDVDDGSSNISPLRE
jgi:hypothetical protein